jgi:hypothetical protein
VLPQPRHFGTFLLDVLGRARRTPSHAQHGADRPPAR